MLFYIIEQINSQLKRKEQVMDYYDKLLQETSAKLDKAMIEIGGLKFRVDYLLNAIKRINETDDANLVKAISRNILDSCSDWNNGFVK